MKRSPEEAKQAQVAYRNICRAEVEWYRRYGRYKDRIATDREGVNFVIGDWSWNRLRPDRKEYVEAAMPRPNV